MQHHFHHRAAACAAILVLALLQSACSEGLQADASNHVAPSLMAHAGDGFVGGEYLPSQYPAPQGEVQELPAQF